MFRLQAQCNLRLWQSLLQHNTYPAHFISRRSVSMHYNIIKSELGPPVNAIHGYAPRFAAERSTNAVGPRSKLNTKEIKGMKGLIDDLMYVAHRLLGTNLRIELSKYKNPWRLPTWPNLDDDIWGHGLILRDDCLRAFLWSYPVSEEIQARKMCARLKDPRYPRIYHSCEDQAHALYLLGRVELEKKNAAPSWRGFGWYMLSIAAGLGQLDAALLLHQLEKIEPQRVVEREARAIIAKAADDAMDWRALVAHSEHLALKMRGATGLSASKRPDFNRCVQLLTDAMRLTEPLLHPPVKREKPNKGDIDVDTLEMFDPPYRLLLNLLKPIASLNQPTEDHLRAFGLACKTGAFDYGDAEAAWQWAQCYHMMKWERDAVWAECMEIAACSGDAEACFELAKYHLEKDGWYPSATANVLDEIEQERRKDREEARDIGEYGLMEVTDGEKHKRIMARKNEELLATQEGAVWMIRAARLQTKKASSMVNRYCIVAGLLRQNGHLDEGLLVVREARDELKKHVGQPEVKAQALKILDDLIEHWDSKFVHLILTPKETDGLLNPSPRQ